MSTSLYVTEWKELACLLLGLFLRGTTGAIADIITHVKFHVRRFSKSVVLRESSRERIAESTLVYRLQ